MVPRRGETISLPANRPAGVAVAGGGTPARLADPPKVDRICFEGQRIYVAE
jgi:hypothetical protein